MNSQTFPKYHTRPLTETQNKPLTETHSSWIKEFLPFNLSMIKGGLRRFDSKDECAIAAYILCIR